MILKLINRCSFEFQIKSAAQTSENRKPPKSSIRFVVTVIPLQVTLYALDRFTEATLKTVVKQVHTSASCKLQEPRKFLPRGGGGWSKYQLFRPERIRGKNENL